MVSGARRRQAPNRAAPGHPWTFVWSGGTARSPRCGQRPNRCCAACLLSLKLAADCADNVTSPDQDGLETSDTRAPLRGCPCVVVVQVASVVRGPGRPLGAISGPGGVMRPACSPRGVWSTWCVLVDFSSRSPFPLLCRFRATGAMWPDGFGTTGPHVTLCFRVATASAGAARTGEPCLCPDQTDLSPAQHLLATECHR